MFGATAIHGARREVSLRRELKGQVLKKVHTKAAANRIAELAQLLGTKSGEQTARVALFLGITISRDFEIVEKLGIDMERTLMAGHEIQWVRPFEPDEEVVVTVKLHDVFDKEHRRFSVVETIIETPSGEEIQRQFSTYVMFAAASPAKG